jgi:hypothetical protein
MVLVDFEWRRTHHEGHEEHEGRESKIADLGQK